ISKLIFEHKVKKEAFAKQIGRSRQTLDNYLNGITKIPLVTLEKIAKYFNLPITYFIDDSSAEKHNVIQKGKGNAASIYGNAVAGELENKEKEIENLKQLLKEKERTIQILMKKNKTS
ncbi:MAG: helix-turn-helix transcriptional regulator, partial [Prevotellaceae bacterium]|nr:helix-turn-helix transcriptional regulator [Prevotellaceae bacterium]